MHRLLGTAGHVDHGKTSLIRALTGIDADRLPEEKRRGLTIDIGFARLDLEGVGRVSIVDVPGHDRFVSNMLVGALTMNAVLLCIAADEGVMPQTREHVGILELLPVDRMVVALTKSDMVEADWREMAELEVESWLASTRFTGSPIAPVSAHTGSGLEDLKRELTQALAAPLAGVQGGWWLAIDRVFTLPGHGAVVTGAVVGGTVRVGDSVTVLPGALDARVKSIHSFDQTVDQADPGMRAALNLTGVKTSELRRGMVAAKPGLGVETTCLDLKLKVVSGIKHGSEVRLAIGAEDALGRVFLNDHDPTVVQVELYEAVAAIQGQAVILRRHSPADLLGGGRVMAPLSTRRRKKDRPGEEMTADSVEDQIVEVCRQAAGVETDAIARRIGRTAASLAGELESLKASGRLLGFAGIWFEPEAFASAAERLCSSLNDLHRLEPEKAGVPREVVMKKAGLNWSGKPLDRILTHLAGEDRVRVLGAQIAAFDHRPALKPKQEALLVRVTELLDQAGLTTPKPGELADKLNVPPQAIDEILKVGLDAGRLVRVEDGIFYSNEAIAALVEKTKAEYGDRYFTAAEFRDFHGASRRHVIPMLEHWDARRITQRQGDARRFV